MIFTHNISPIIAEIGPLELRWYGLLFATGLMLNYSLLYYVFKKQKHDVKHLDSLVIYLFFGLLLGARFGHILFYNASYFFSHPVEILKVWNGGLASHGAAIGLFVAYLLWTRVKKVKFSKYVDIIALGMPLTAAFVRLGNFFNSEIVGNFTSGDYGVVFAKLGETLPRHPVQLYSSLMNLLIFAVLIFVYKKYYKKTAPMFIAFLYIGLYFAGRFIVEFWKDLHALPESFPLSMGQVLSIIPILIALAYFIFFYPKQKTRTTNP